jgi:PAS domain S-box-containing protein
MLFDTPRISSRLDLLYLVTSEFNAGIEINEVLYNVLMATIASVGASEAMLFLVDENGQLEDSVIIRGFERRDYGPDTRQALFEGGLIGWVWKNQRGAVITDTKESKFWYEKAITADVECVLSAVSVPIRKSPEPALGVIAITSDKRDHFDDSDLAMLTIIADQAAFALTNARLFKAEQHRRKVADTLASISHTINSSLDLNEVLNLILEQLALVVDYDSSSIQLYDESKAVLAVHAARGFKDMKEALQVRLPYDEAVPNYQAILMKKPVVIGDVDLEPNWIKSSSSQNVKSWIGAPLIAHDNVVGLLAVDSFEIDKYTQENATVVAAFAEQAATAVANAQTVMQLQRAEASYEVLFEDSTDIIILTDYSGVIHNVNRKGCQILRRPKDAVIGLGITFFAPTLKDFLNEKRKRLQAWREVSIEIEIFDAYKQTIPLDVRVRHIQFGGTEYVEWVGRDISRRKEIERMRQDLVNMLVHDLRGPLGNLINTIDLMSMLVQTTGADERLERFLEIGKRTGRTLIDLVDSMLDVSRLEQGEVPLQCDWINVEYLIEQVSEQVGPQAAAKEVELTIAPVSDEVPIEVWIDHGLIRRVLVNLIINAIKYTTNDAKIWLNTDIETDQLHFAVKDNGPGISAKDQQHIFDKFSRLQISADGPAGVGLGLAFCKLAAEAHKGTITVESSGIAGEGSTFHVYLPLEKM